MADAMTPPRGVLCKSCGSMTFPSGGHKFDCPDMPASMRPRRRAGLMGGSLFGSDPFDDPNSCESMYGMSNADLKDLVMPDEGDHG